MCYEKRDRGSPLSRFGDCLLLRDRHTLQHIGLGCCGIARHDPSDAIEHVHTFDDPPDFRELSVQLGRVGAEGDEKLSVGQCPDDAWFLKGAFLFSIAVVARIAVGRVAWIAGQGDEVIAHVEEIGTVVPVLLSQEDKAVDVGW